MRAENAAPHVGARRYVGAGDGRADLFAEMTAGASGRRAGSRSAFER